MLKKTAFLLFSLLSLLVCAYAYTPQYIQTINLPNALIMNKLSRMSSIGRPIRAYFSPFSVSPRHTISALRFSDFSTSSSSSPSPSSVSKMHWEEGPLHIRMYTKGGCTLCDVVKAGFSSLRDEGGEGFTFEVRGGRGDHCCCQSTLCCGCCSLITPSPPMPCPPHPPRSPSTSPTLATKIFTKR